MFSTEDLYKIFKQHPVISTDSRKIAPQSIFFALKGANFNGNKFAAQALEKGAAYAVIDEANFKANEKYLLVGNVLESLQALATHHRQQFDIPVISITGSNGKTTTKELISTVFASHYKTHFTKGNFNNHIGVPLTLLDMKMDTEVAIIEMGANHVGEIDFLCNIACPTHGLITNIGKAHLEGFGSLEGVKQGKSELYRHLAAHKGMVFINMDEAYLEDLAKENTLYLKYLKSEKPQPTVKPYETQLLESEPYITAGFLSENGTQVKVESKLYGKYNFNNIMTAIVVGRYFKVPSDKIKKAIETYIPANNRSELLEKGSNTFILDAYNANPTSMKNALMAFAKLNAKNKIAILGDMLELGEESTLEHVAIYDLARRQNFQQTLFVGKEFTNALPQSANTFDNVDLLKGWFDRQNFKNTHFLIKGSRGIRLEQLLKES